MRVIIADKLMQYGIVGGEDVVRWVFSTGSWGVGAEAGEGKDGEEWMAGQKWDLLRMGVDKVNGRVVGVRRKIVQLEAEEEERRGGRRAATAVGMDEDGNGTAGMEMDTGTTEDGSGAGGDGWFFPFSSGAARRFLRSFLRRPRTRTNFLLFSFLPSFGLPRQTNPLPQPP